MDSAQDDRHAALTELVRELVRPRGVTGHHRDAHQIRRVLEIDLPDRLVLDLGIPMLRRVGRDGRQTELGKPDRLSLARPEMVRVLPRIGVHQQQDRKSTRLNSSHGYISYAVFCLKKNNMTCTTLWPSS